MDDYLDNIIDDYASDAVKVDEGDTVSTTQYDSPGGKQIGKSVQADDRYKYGARGGQGPQFKNPLKKK